MKKSNRPKSTTHGSEPEASQLLFRAELDPQGELQLTISDFKLPDIKLWGCALADIAISVSRLHATPLNVRRSEMEVMDLSEDTGDFELNLMMICKQFYSEMQYVTRGTPMTHAVDPVQAIHRSEPEMHVGDLSMGDRFVLDRQLFMITRVEDDGIQAANLDTGQISCVAPSTEVVAIRRQRS